MAEWWTLLNFFFYWIWYIPCFLFVKMCRETKTKKKCGCAYKGVCAPPPPPPLPIYHLIGLLVEIDVLRVDNPEFDSCFWRGDFSGLSHTSDLIGTLVATLPGTWCQRWDWLAWCQYTVSGWGRKWESLICNFYIFSVAARTIVWADPTLRYTSLLLGR